MGDEVNPVAPNDVLADAVWNKIMDLAEKHALVVQAYGGSATLATPAAQRDAGIRNKCLRMVRFKEEDEKPETSVEENKNMAKTKKANDGDEMIDDDDAPVATASKKTRTPKASKRGSAPKAQTKKQKVGGRKTGPAASKAKAKAKVSSNGKRERKSVEHKAPKAGSKFTAKYKGKTHTMTVKKAKDGSVAYVVKGKAYKTPSAAAASVITAGQKNGWTFWSID